MKIKYWCAIHRMSLPLENISNSAAKNSSLLFNKIAAGNFKRDSK